jgi:hypothetical protein
MQIRWQDNNIMLAGPLFSFSIFKTKEMFLERASAYSSVTSPTSTVFIPPVDWSLCQEENEATVFVSGFAEGRW